MATIHRSWTRFGLWTGGLTLACYLVRFVPNRHVLPDAIGNVPWFSFGVFFALFSLALYRVMQPAADGPVLQGALLCNALAAGLNAGMFTVQGATFTIGFDFIERATDPSTRALAYQIMNTTNAAQLGLGMAWDIFLAAGILLFAFAMRADPRFGRWLCGAGIVVAILLLVLNFWTFPMPPAEAGLVDVGPGVGIWYTLVLVQLARSRDGRGRSRDPLGSAAP